MLIDSLSGVIILIPGSIRMTAGYVQGMPEILERWSNLNPMGRIGRPDELRGVIAWLASDASSFCTGSEYVFRLELFNLCLLIIWI